MELLRDLVEIAAWSVLIISGVWVGWSFIDYLGAKTGESRSRARLNDEERWGRAAEAAIPKQLMGFAPPKTVLTITDDTIILGGKDIPTSAVADDVSAKIAAWKAEDMRRGKPLVLPFPVLVVDLRSRGMLVRDYFDDGKPE